MEKLQLRSRILIVLSALCLILGIGSRTLCQTKVMNVLGALGDFEHDCRNTGVGCGWEREIVGPLNGSFSLDSSTFKTGAKSQAISVSGASAFSYARIWRTEYVGGNNLLQPGNRLTVSADYHTTSVLRNCGFESTVTVYDSSWNKIQRITFFVQEEKPTTTWTTFANNTQTFPTITLPSNAAYVVFAFSLKAWAPDSSGTVWLDNIVFNNGLTYTPISRKRQIKTLFWSTEPCDLYSLARDFDAIIWSELHHEAIHTLKMYNPNIKVFLYEVCGFTNPNSVDFDRANDPIGYKWINENHPEWFLHWPDGSRVIDRANFSVLPYAVDPRFPEYQKLWASNAIKKCKQYGFEGIFLDQVMADYTWISPTGELQWPVEYPNQNEDWKAGVTAFLEELRKQIDQTDIVVVGNFGLSNWGVKPWDKWSQSLNGAFDEHCFTYYTASGENKYYVYETWKGELDSLVKASKTTQASSKAPTKIYWAQMRLENSDASKRRFGLASFLLGCGSEGYLSCQPYSYSGSTYNSDFDVNLGTPVRDYKQEAGYLFSRQFTKGMVYVNPSENKTYRVRMEQNYTSIDGKKTYKKGSSITVSPHTGLILLSAGSTRR